MATNPTIQFKRKITSGTPSSLALGEPAVNTADNQLFVGVNSSAVKWVGAEIENSSTNGTTWTSDLKLATKKAIGDYFMPLGGGSFTGDVSLAGGSDIRFIETGGGSDYVAFQAPASIATSVTWTLPSADGSSGEVLSTNGSGILTWASAGSATTVTTNSDNTNTTRYMVFSTTAQSGATLYVDDTTTALSYNPSTARLTVSGDVDVNGGDLITSASTASVFDTNATTLTIGAAATTGTVGYSSTGTSTTNISTGAVGSGNTKTVNVGTGGAASSTTNVNIGSANGGTVTVNSNMTVSGDLTVNGTTTTVNSTTLSVTDPLIFLANDNDTTDTVDIGFYGLYDTSGSQDLYTGIFRDASDDKFKLFKGLQTAPTTTVNTGGTGYSVATLVADIEGKVNGLTVTSSTGTLTITNGKTLSVSNTLTFTGTDSSSVAFGAGGTVAYTSNKLSVFAATSSSELAGVISDETGTGSLVFSNSPSLTTPAIGSGGFTIAGSSSGTTSFLATAAASGTITFPAVTGTVITTGNLSDIGDAAADGSTKGIATFNSTQFDSASGVITLDTIDGGTYT